MGASKPTADTDAANFCCLGAEATGGENPGRRGKNKCQRRGQGKQKETPSGSNR